MGKRTELNKSELASLKRAWWRFKHMIESENGGKKIGVERLLTDASLRYRFLCPCCGTVPAGLVEMDPSALIGIANNTRKADKLSDLERQKAENYGKRGPRKRADGLF